MMKNLFTYLLLIIGFTVSAQSLTSVSPNTAAAGTTLNVTITGNRTAFTNSTIFVFSQGTSVLQVSNVDAQSGTSASATITVPANALAGSYSLSAIIGLSIPLQLANAFTVTGGVTNPAIQTVSPNEATAGQTLLVTITGLNTEFSQSSSTTTSLVSFTGGTPILALTSIPQSNTSLRCLFTIPNDATPGDYSVVMNTSNQGLLTKLNAFTVNERPLPQLVSVTPKTANSGQSLNVSIVGTNSRFLQASSIEVYLVGVAYYTSSSATAQSNTRIRATFDLPTNARTGLYDVYVFDGENYLGLEESFTIIGNPAIEPKLISVHPPYANRGQQLDVTITGANTNFMQPTSVINCTLFNSATTIYPSAIRQINNTEMIATFTIPNDANFGMFSVDVESIMDGFLEMENAISIVSVGVKEEQTTVSKIFPNPAKSILYIENKLGIKSVSILNIEGKEIKVANPESSKQNVQYEIDLGELNIQKGIYFVRVETNEGFDYQKIIIE